MAAPFVGLWVYQEYIGQFVADVSGEHVSGVSAGSLAVRRLGAMNRHLIWPGYESKMRRSLIKAHRTPLRLIDHPLRVACDSPDLVHGTALG